MPVNLTRWSKPIPPKWLGNDQDPQGFTLRYKRMSEGELRALRDALIALRENKDASAADLAAALKPYVQGPKAPDGAPVALVVDGHEVRDGDFEALLKVGLDDGPGVHTALNQEVITTLMREVNGLTGAAEGESEGSRGGASTTRAGDIEAAPPVPNAGA
jgi:hypothetical protein